MVGALAGIRVIEMGGIGPGPFAAMMLGDHGAEVIRIDRPREGNPKFLANPSADVLMRSRRAVIELDVRKPDGAKLVRELCASADVVIEGYRPGVMERLGLGPDVLLAENRKLVYGRITGWGQTGPMAATAGHDLTYIALTGNLHSYGRAGSKPTPPINAVGDFGGGGMLLAFGVMAALVSARATGTGQVVDAAMTDGAALLASMIWGLRADGKWHDERGVNLLDTGAPFYDTYETQDGHYMAMAPLEAQFYAQFLQIAGLAEDADFANQSDRSFWPVMREKLTHLFKSQPRDHWVTLFAGTDACVAPVLSMAEALAFPHNIERCAFIGSPDTPQPAPAPRFSQTPAEEPAYAPATRETNDSVLMGLGLDAQRIAALRSAGVIA
jgi:alpha-methylacyl-CoA racemase